MSEMELEARKQAAELAKQLALESLTSVRQMSSSGIRALFLVNAGATLAVLTLIGQSWQRFDELTDIELALVPIGLALVSYVAGLILSIFVSGLAYINFSIMEANSAAYWEIAEIIRDGTYKRSHEPIKGAALTARLALALSVLSVLAFSFGTYFSFQAIAALAITK